MKNFNVCLIVALVTPLVLLAATPSWGAIFRTVDAAGNVTYTDQPPRGSDTRVTSEQIEVTRPNIFEDSTPRARWETDLATSSETAATSYELAITSPENDTAFRENAGDITVRTRITPALADEHVARLELNGTLMPAPLEGGSFYLSNVSRGTHRARLIVENSNGRRLSESPEIVFHLQRISRLLPPRARTRP